MKILVPFLSNPPGRAAVERAVEEASLRAGQIQLLGHVRVADADAGGEVWQLRQDLEETANRLRSQGLNCEAEWSLGLQTLSAKVIEVATDWGADLIILGIRRRSRVGKLILGSHVQSILLEADCPVLTVRATDHG
jgi:nucleotide-binding universal stress UspA family protein